MAALSHPSSIGMFAPPNPNGMGGPPGAPNHSPYHIPPHYHQQPAPRQRTAIACRYCRRRKIRCSGFETSPDGRCANCMRFNQECVFTPVSSQPGNIQAFVPAHALVSRHPGGELQLYGAQGQPLPPSAAAGFSLPQPSVAHDGSSPYPGRAAAPPGLLHHHHHPAGAADLGYAAHPDDRSRGLGPQAQGPVSALDPPPPPPPPPPYHPPRRRSAEDYPSRYAEQPPSPSSHLPAPGHAAFPPPAPLPLNGSPATYSPAYAHAHAHGPSPPPPPPPLPAASGSYYPALPNPTAQAAQAASQQQQQQQQRQRRQRSDSPVSRQSSGERSTSPQPHAGFHPPMVFPPREPAPAPGPSSPVGPIPPMQMANLPPNPPSHQQRSATDGEMLMRLNFRTGI